MNDRQRLEAIIGVVCRYLPPGGIPANEAMSQTIALVDPLPEPVQEPDAVVTGYHGGQCVITPTDPARVFNTGTVFYTQPTDHSEQHLNMVDHGDELTIAYLDGVHTGKQIAKREWVGLTNEECIEIAARGYPRWLEFAQAVEAKLREKNGGGA
jgi:hypothetical protein